MNRRRVLVAALMGGGGAALSACVPAEDSSEADIWAGYDERITERSLAEAEKLFGLQFSEAERRLILGGPVEEGAEDEEGFFAKQVENLNSMRSQEMPNSFAPTPSRRIRSRYSPRRSLHYPTMSRTLPLLPSSNRQGG